MYHADAYLCRALRYFHVFSDQQMQKKKKEAASPHGPIIHVRVHSPIQPVDCSLLRCPSSRSAGFVALDLAETSRVVETWLQCSRGIDSTGVPRRWQGQQLIGPKWEWRGRLIAIDPLPPPAGSSIFDYDHFTPNQVCASCDGGNPVERY